MTTYAILRHRRDTAANWTAEDPTLYDGQLGWETDTGLCKLGDGTTAWTSLRYVCNTAAQLIGDTDDTLAADSDLRVPTQQAIKAYVDSLPMWRVVAASAVAVSCPADTTEDQLASITIPANSLGANGGCRIHTLWTCTSSANNKTMRVRWSGAAGTAILSTVQTTVAFLRDVREFWNQNATNSQRYHAATTTYGTGGTATGTMAVDTTASSAVVITGQKASAGETLTLNWYCVERFKQA